MSSYEIKFEFSPRDPQLERRARILAFQVLLRLFEEWWRALPKVDTPIFLSPHTRRALLKAEIYTLAAANRFSNEELLSLERFGRKALEEVREAAAARSFALI